MNINHDQLRAASALECARADSKAIRGKEGGNVIDKLPALVLNHGLLATLSFSIGERKPAKDTDLSPIEKIDTGDGVQKKSGAEIAFDYIARHLSSDDVGIADKKLDSAEALLDYLNSKPSEVLRAATDETMAWLAFARRFVGNVTRTAKAS